VLRRFALVVFLFVWATLPALALDRNAFSFTHYDLRVTLDPHQHGLAVEGTVEVRNASQVPQREISLQISSSLRWLSVRVDGAEVEWLEQSYTSDIDHTGLLNEAIIKLERPLGPGEALRLNLRYSGTVKKDTTRLERIGTPADIAQRSDWDEISDRFTALRGAGFVVWYPVSMDSANLSQGNEVFETMRDWREREASAVLSVQLSKATAPEEGEAKFMFVANGTPGAVGPAITEEFRGVDPVIVLLDDAGETADRPDVAAYYTAAHTKYARDYMAAAETVIPALEEWFGSPRRKVVLVELTDPNALPFDSGAYYFVPMREVPHAAAEVALARPVVHAMLESPRPWIREGLAGFAQALIRERQAGRHAALAHLGQFNSALAVAETQSHSSPQGESNAAKIAPQSPGIGLQPLISTADEVFFRIKAGYVWWMLRDMVGDRVLQSALTHYRAAEDRDTAYMQRLIEKQDSPKRDLEAFFDDWVYRDRGLPQLRVQSAYVRQTLGTQTVTAVTVENLGETWCEVPVSVRSPKGTNMARVVVAGKSKATVRVSFEAAPSEAEVNDGSVPEAERRDNVIPVTATSSVEH
jgi:hypothetical protein